MIEIKIPPFPEKEFSEAKKDLSFVVAECAARWAWEKAYAMGYMKAVREHVLDLMNTKVEQAMDDAFDIDLGIGGNPEWMRKMK